MFFPITTFREVVGFSTCKCEERLRHPSQEAADTLCPLNRQNGEYCAARHFATVTYTPGFDNAGEGTNNIRPLRNIDIETICFLDITAPVSPYLYRN